MGSNFPMGGGGARGEGTCPDTRLNKVNVFCLIVTDYDITKNPWKLKKKLRHKCYAFQYSKTYITVVEHK